MSEKIRIFNIPNMITFYRLAVIPLVFLLFYKDALIVDEVTTLWVNVFLVFLAGISDYVDGYVARKMGQSSLLGKFLDSSMDKVLVTSLFIILISFYRIEGLWIILVLLIIVRELLISGVREYMAHHDIVVPVSWVAKFKLAFQLLAVGFYTAGPYGDMLVPYAPQFAQAFLIIAATLTVISGFDYIRGSLKALRDKGAL